jgi:hypothetical protein
MKRKRQRACHHCGVGFVPKPHNHSKQRYCPATECQAMSKRVSQARWRANNLDYHRGPVAVRRVQQWRVQNPGYWRRKKAPLENRALQDDCISQAVDEQPDGANLEEIALRDNCITQVPILLGLMSILSGFTLQEDIDRFGRELHNKGRQILGTGPVDAINRKSNQNHAKTYSRSKTPAPRAGPL